MSSAVDFLIRLCWRHRLVGHRTLTRLLVGSRRVRARTTHDILLRLDPSEFVDGAILHDGFYEPIVLEALLQALRPDDTFWDVGSNIGLQALTVKKLRPDVHVVAFEPNPNLQPLITAAAAENHLPVDLMSLALSDGDGTAPFFLYPGNCGASALRHDGDKAALTRVEVALARGDRLVREQICPAPSVIKMDVERHEFEACRGLGDLLSGPALRTIVLEDLPDPATPVQRLLAENGFSLRLLPRLDEQEPYNYVAEKKDS
jgi:FkbM family methyltransferase